MVVETKREDVIAELQDRVDSLTQDSKQEMEAAGDRLGHALWKFPVAGFSTWFFLHVPELLSKSSEEGLVWSWFVSAGIAGTFAYFGTQDILVGIHHIRIHNSIMREILSHRALINRRFEEILHSNN